MMSPRQRWMRNIALTVALAAPTPIAMENASAQTDLRANGPAILTWHRVGGEQVRSVSAADLVRPYLSTGTIVDHGSSWLDDPFDDYGRIRADFVRVEGVQVTSMVKHAALSTPLTLFFDADSGVLLVACTDQRPRRAPESTENRRAPKEALEHRWAIQPLLGATESTVEEVLGAAWSHYGIRVDKVGQIAVRPRAVSDMYAVNAEDRGVPDTRWVVQSEGGRHRLSHGYRTGQMAVFRDTNLMEAASSYR